MGLVVEEFAVQSDRPTQEAVGLVDPRDRHECGGVCGGVWLWWSRPPDRDRLVAVATRRSRPWQTHATAATNLVALVYLPNNET